MSALTHSQQVALRISLVEPRLLSSSHTFLTHPSLRRLFPEYMFRLYCAVRAVVPLMETARARAMAMAATCPVAALLVPYLQDHIAEETGHDQWLLEDLEVLGLSRSEVLSRPPARTVAALVGSQYYWVQHVHPVGLLGYMAMFEGYPPARQEIDQVQGATGYGAEAFRTHLLHADLDPHHGDDLDHLLDSLRLTEQQRTLIGLNAIASVQLITQAQQELLDRF